MTIRPDLAIKLNKRGCCAGCGVSGEPLSKYFWNEYDFKYCSECYARRKKNVTPDWARVMDVSATQRSSKEDM